MNSQKKPEQRIKYGWYVFDVVTVGKEWCCLCAKSRVHEYYSGLGFCIGCGNQSIVPVVTPEGEPGLDIERFIKEGV